MENKNIIESFYFNQINVPVAIIVSSIVLFIILFLILLFTSNYLNFLK